MPGSDLTVWFLRYRDHGDAVSLERVVAVCSPLLRRLAGRWCSAREAEDLAQEVFLIALQNAAAFDASKPLLPWLFGILHNLARSARRARRWSRGGVSGQIEESSTPANQGPFEALLRKDWLDRVGAAIIKLRDPYRTVVFLAVVSGDPPSTIAARLGRSPSTVRTQLERGLRDLRTLLNPP